MNKLTYVMVLLATLVLTGGALAKEPSIANVTANYTVSTASIHWNTNQTAYHNAVYYGATSALGTTATTLTNSTSMLIALSGLSSHTKYYYATHSCDSGTNCTNSTTYSFTTPYDCASADNAIACDTLEGLPSAGTNLGGMLSNLAPGLGMFLLYCSIFVVMVLGVIMMVVTILKGNILK